MLVVEKRDRERSRDAKDASNEKSEEENLQSIIQRTGATFLLAALRVNFGEIWNDLDVQSKDARMKGCGASSRIHYEVLILYVVCWFWPLAGETGAACMYRLSTWVHKSAPKPMTPSKREWHPWLRANPKWPRCSEQTVWTWELGILSIQDIELLHAPA